MCHFSEPSNSLEGSGVSEVPNLLFWEAADPHTTVNPGHVGSAPGEHFCAEGFKEIQMA